MLCVFVWRFFLSDCVFDVCFIVFTMPWVYNKEDDDDDDRPTRRPPLDKQCRLAIIISRRSFAAWKTPNRRPVCDRVLPCRPSHANNMSFNSVSQWSCLIIGRCGVLWSPQRRPPGRPPTSPTARAVGDVGGRPRRLARTSRQGRPPMLPWRSAM